MTLFTFKHDCSWGSMKLKVCVVYPPLVSFPHCFNTSMLIILTVEGINV